MLVRDMGPNTVIFCVILKSEELRCSMSENALAVEHYVGWDLLSKVEPFYQV